MTLVDILFLTAVNAIACIILPKFLFTISTAKYKQVKPPSENIELNRTSTTDSTEVPSFPY
ncbi:hypothetical protein [Brunnivagina elsteri]|uniref:Uncharacterized protein n=1 Tax=Brunnivagina elsteri CCALA 953 TaxID=987040 RepID=A0A2A2THW8_9CYAN|nr:hypothetical protein [Calothrix elsteri]PAX53322.1 hypothetical protein CK510_14615 [Calothrix elsteri CCALA 953]